MRLLLVSILTTVLALSAWAELPLTKWTGARPISLGTAYVGIADDGPALFVNAAGLAEIKNLTFTSTYNQPVEDVIITALGLALPNRFGGTLGIGYRNRTASNVLISSEVGSTSDQEILVSYSRKAGEKVSAGITLRYGTMADSINVSKYSSSNSRAVDLSLKYDYLPWCHLGFAWINLGAQTFYPDGTAESIDQIIRLGTLFKPWDKLGLSIDLAKEGDTPFTLHAGLEWKVLGPLALRLGADQTVVNQAQNYTNLTAGLGLRAGGITIDYAWYRQADPSQDITHTFSLGYVGPEEPKKIAEKPAGPVYPSPQPKPAIATTLKRVRFSDLSDDNPVKEPAELLATAGLISGYPDKTFRPNIKLSRNHFSIMLLAAKNLQSNTPEKDVGGAEWVQNPNQYVTRGEAASLMMVGLEENIDRPDDVITRGEFVILFSETSRAKAAIKRLPPLKD